MTQKRFVVVSGLPGSGKSTVARLVSPALNLPVIDKDDILERLFDSKGVGDASWRRALSRESDVIFEEEAKASDGALLVSFWRLEGMASKRGNSYELAANAPGPRCKSALHLRTGDCRGALPSAATASGAP